MVARGRGRGKWESGVQFVSVGEEEKVLELDDGDGCITVRVCT